MSINITQLTSNVQNTDGNITGDGIFDKIMETLNINIKAQYDSGKITGSDYAQVYIQAIQSALSNATQIFLKEELINQELAFNDNSNAKKIILMDKEISKADSDKSLIDAQVLSVNKDIDVKNAQVDNINSEISLRDEQKLTETSKRLNLDKDIDVKNAQEALINAQKGSEDNKSLLLVRQKAAYDDKLRIEEATQLANIMGMFGAGGTSLPSELETATLDAINRITT